MKGVGDQEAKEGGEIMSMCGEASFPYTRFVVDTCYQEACMCRCMCVKKLGEFYIQQHKFCITKQ